MATVWWERWVSNIGSAPHRLIEMVTLHFSDQINYLGKGQKLMSISSLTLNLPSYLLVRMIVFMVLPMLKNICCCNRLLRVLSLRGSGFLLHNSWDQYWTLYPKVITGILIFAKNDWDMQDLIFQEETEKTVIGRSPSWCQNPVLSISLFSAKSGQTSNRKVPCFTNKVLEWYKHMLQIHNFPWWQDQSYSSANYIHCSTELSVNVHSSQFHNQCSNSASQV